MLEGKRPPSWAEALRNRGVNSNDVRGMNVGITAADAFVGNVKKGSGDGNEGSIGGTDKGVNEGATTTSTTFDDDEMDEGACVSFFFGVVFIHFDFYW